MLEISGSIARFYDPDPDPPADVPFYISLLPSGQSSILELGCGSGRVLVPLSQHCGSISGIDTSTEMLAVCLSRLRSAGVPPERADAVVGDISAFDLGRRFDLVIGPYGIAQNLTRDVELGGMLACVRQHLGPHGTCVLTASRPKLAPQDLRQRWPSEDERLCWDVPTPSGRVTCHERRVEMDSERLVLYPELVFRRYEGQDLCEEASIRVPRRCYYPDEFCGLIADHGFEIRNRWGGYRGEPYGVGPELIVQFAPAA